MKNKRDVVENIRRSRIVAILRGIYDDQAMYIIETLLQGGINCVEVPFDQCQLDEQTVRTVDKAVQTYGSDLIVGTGTVMSCEQVEISAQAGAQFLLSPNVDSDVIQQAFKLGLVCIPGAYTPTECAKAWSDGADIVKLFPAGVGGITYLRALINGPLNHIPFMAVGNISIDDAAQYLKNGACAVGLGSSLVGSTGEPQGLSVLQQRIKHLMRTIEGIETMYI